MKKTILTLLIAAILLTLTACDKDTTSTQTSQATPTDPDNIIDISDLGD